MVKVDLTYLPDKDLFDKACKFKEKFHKSKFSNDQDLFDEYHKILLEIKFRIESEIRNCKKSKERLKND